MFVGKKNVVFSKEKTNMRNNLSGANLSEDITENLDKAD